MTDPLRVRWLGRVPYGEALELQRALFTHGGGNHLLLLVDPAVQLPLEAAELLGALALLRCRPPLIQFLLVSQLQKLPKLRVRSGLLLARFRDLIFE